MLPTDQASTPANPKDLLQEQVSLLKEMKVSLSALQESQTYIQQGMANLVKLNVTNTKDGLGVLVKNVNMPFMAMVGFMIKWAIATIPAVVILFVFGGMVLLVISVACGGLTGILTGLSKLR